MTTLAERIRTSRKQLGISQKVLGQKAGVHQQMISRLENGHSRYTARFKELAAALGVNQAWLVTGIGPSEPGAQRELDDFAIVSDLLNDDQRQMMARLMRDLLKISSDA